MQLPRRPADHADLPQRRRGHRRRRGRGRAAQVLTPEEIALALSAADQVADRHQRVSRAAELAVDRARYEADRAERAFHAVEPENRMVARSLESRWEARLVAVAEAEQALAAAHDSLPPLPSRTDLERSPRTCPSSGTRRPPATRTANGCCAP